MILSKRNQFSKVDSLFDDGYMTQEQLEFFKERLIEEKRLIISELEGKRKDESSNTYVKSSDGCDLALDELRIDLLCNDYNRKYEELEIIDDCLMMIERGDYGYCVETGRPIGIKRLLANPKAKMCIEVQEKYDRREMSKELYNEENGLDDIGYQDYVSKLMSDSDY